MLSEMGSNFWFEPEEVKGSCDITPEIYGIGGDDYIWTYSGRQAISFVLDTLLGENDSFNKVALLPPYTCHTVFNPFYNYGFDVYSYEIDEHFISTKEMILKRAKEVKPGVVLLQRYFGFDTIKEAVSLTEELKELGIIVIEDATQAIFSKLDILPVDYHVASVRKYFGTPDGGFVVSHRGKLNRDKFISNDERRNELVLEASSLKNKYMSDMSGDKKEFLKLFGEAEEMLDEDNSFRYISDTALKIQSSNDNENIAQRRRENYRLLYSLLKDVKGMRIVFSEPEDNEAPLYMPIYVDDDRLKLQAHLRNASIYAPVVWPRPERCPEYLGEVGDDFYNHIICLLVDQRYDEGDIKREAYRVKEFFEPANVEPDIFYMDNYVKLFKNAENGVGYGIYRYDHKDGTVLYPYVKRLSPELDDKSYFDIITPLGFNGPLVINKKSDNLTELVDDFNNDFDEYCKREHIITEYIRFCPWEYNAELFSRYYELRDNHSTIAIDLTVKDILMDEIDSKRRNQIRSAIKKGVKIEYDFTGKTVDKFYELYQGTIAKNHIGEYYDFSIDFLRDHFKYLKGNVFIANAVVNDEIISSSFIFLCGNNIHYHLSANDYTKNIYNGNSLLLYEVAKFGKALGCHYFHLGGVGVAEKSLMDFKTSFTKKGVYPFYVSRKVRNQEVYDKLCAKYAKKDSTYFPAYRG